MLTDRIIGRVGADILSRRLADSRQVDANKTDSAALFQALGGGWWNSAGANQQAPKPPANGAVQP